MEAGKQGCLPYDARVAMSQVTIRKAVPDDAERLLAYFRQVLEEPDIDLLTSPGEFNYTIDDERKLVDERARSDNSVFLLAEVDGQIIGLLGCEGGKRRKVRHVTVLGMSVRKDWRDRGVGKALMAHAINWAKSTGVVKRIELSVFARNARALHLYEQCGFVIEGRRRRAICQNGEYLDLLEMGLLLD
jgi:RimJ/RimL family protein N-acetyltransferase